MKRLSRRQLLQASAGLGLSALLPQPHHSFGSMWSRNVGARSREVAPITPNDEFYITSYRTPPFVPIENWNLTITGHVTSPVSLTYSQLRARPIESEIVTLECVGNGVAGEAIGTAEWTGASLKLLLDEAGIDRNAYDVVFRAADGYSDSLSVERVMLGDVLIAHTMNGEPLPLGHGHPARIIAPGMYGMKHIQWLTDIELVPHEYHGYYQKKGWPDEPIVKTTSTITDPQDGDTVPYDNTASIKGFAFTGTRGIRNVEVTTDGGQTWNSTRLQPALSRSAWVFWTHQWEPQKIGDHRILVRAIDGTGQPQSSIEQAPFPNGTTGLHEVIVTVS